MAVYEFGPFHLDSARRTLLKGGEAIPLKPKNLETLVALVENRGRVLEKDEFMRLLWPDTAVEEANLAVQVHAVRKGLGESPESHRYILTIPGRGYRFVAAVKELEPEQGEEPRSLPTRGACWKPSRWRWALLLLAIGVASALAYWWRASRPGRFGEVRSLAVLPFKPFAPAESDLYLELGMADAVINRLTGLGKLVIRPTTAVVNYWGAGKDLRAAGRELGVDALLDGRIHKAADRVRVTVQLVRSKDAATLWAATFDERFTNIFAVQDSISEQVARALALQLTGEQSRAPAKRHTANPEARRHYVLGLFFRAKATAEALRIALENFQKAIELDPGYALAHAGLADAYIGFSTFRVAAGREAYEQAREAATKALQLDPMLPEAHTALAVVRLYNDWDWPGAERAFQRAIQLNPDYATAHQRYGFALAWVSRLDEALAEVKRARELDPASLMFNNSVGEVLNRARRYDEAIAETKRVLEMEPNFRQAHQQLGRAYVQKRMYEEAIAHFHKAGSGANSEATGRLGHAYAVSGRGDQALKTLQELEALSRRSYVSPYDVALIHAGLGNQAQALDWLEKAAAERARAILSLKIEPIFDGLRSEPRFQQLLRRVGLAP